MKKIIGFLIVVLATSCAEKHEFFYISNENFADTNIITVEYVNLDNNDTTQVQINHLKSAKIFETKTVGGKVNWNTDYRVKINYIKNLAGDTINFDPNTIHDYKWIEQTSPNCYYFKLKIDATSFQ